jgi:hypothetical protein
MTSLNRNLQDQLNKEKEKVKQLTDEPKKETDNVTTVSSPSKETKEKP